MLDSWIRVDADGRITVFTGKAELGQGIKTALIQIAAHELAVAPSADRPRHRRHRAHARRRRDRRQPFDAGQRHRDPERRRQRARAAGRSGGLAVRDRGRPDRDARRRRARARTAAASATANWSPALSLHVEAKPDMPRREGGTTVIGENLPRLDIPAKVSGGEAYVQDMRLPGMLHARVVRGPSDGTTAQAGGHRGRRQDARRREGRARRAASWPSSPTHEWRAVKALHRLQAAGWDAPPSRRSPANDLREAIRRLPAAGYADLRLSRPARAGRRAHAARALQPALPDARLDRPVLRRGAVGRRQRDRMDPQPGRLSAAQGARRVARPPARARALRPCRGRGLLRPQRRRRCRGRCSARRPRRARPAGAPAMDARAGAWLGAAGLGDDRRDVGVARRRWPHRRLAARRLEQHPQHAADHRRRPAGRHRGRSAVRAAEAAADPDAGRRRRT